MEILDSPFFELSPIAMWLEDYSEIKKQFDLWREQGIQDLYQFLQEDETRILDCAKKIKILKIILQFCNFYFLRILHFLWKVLVYNISFCCAET